MKRLQHIVFSVLLAACTLYASAQINTEQVVRIGRNTLYFEDYILSIQYFNQAINAKPFLAEPYFYRAVAKINLEDYHGAEADATAAIERNPFIVDAYQVRGVARQNLRNFTDALDDYNHGLELMPEDRSLLLNRAVCLTELHRYDEARQAYEQLGHIDPKNDRAALGLARLCLLQADTTQALTAVNHAIELNKNNAVAHVMQAELLMRSDSNYVEAREALDRAITLEPREPGYYINRAFARYHEDDYDGAMADYDYAISLDPTSVEAHFDRALLLTEVADNNRAIDDFSFVLQRDPQHFMARFNRSMLYFKTGQYRKAISDMDSVLSRYPDFEAGYMARGEAKRLLGNKRGGDADYDHALSIFRSKRTRQSDFNPAQTEADLAALRRRQMADGTLPQPEESSDQTISRFNALLTVPADNPVKPRYANRQRGRIQDNNVDIRPEPPFLLSYYAMDNDLNGATYTLRELTRLNQSRLLPMRVVLVAGEHALTESQIGDRFRSIARYDSLRLIGRELRAVDYFGRGLDRLLLRNPDDAIADADSALVKSADFALALLLRAQARMQKWQMLEARDNTASAPTFSPTTASESATAEKAQQMLQRHEAEDLLRKALADLDQAAKLMPKDPYTLFNMGNVLILMSDHTRAISCYTAAIRLKPDLGQAYYNRGLLRLRLGNKNLGTEDLSKAGELGILPSYNILKRMTN